MAKVYKNPDDFIGKKFNRLTVLSWFRKENRLIHAYVICDCGTSKTCLLYYVTKGVTVSCGCFRAETNTSRLLKHGSTKTPEYQTLYRMKNRCYNTSCDKFKHYGGRGITVCDRWLNSFENFLSDMGPRPSSKHSIERIDVNGNYSPKNCRWATQKEQCNNRTSSRVIEFNGERKTLSQWADFYNLKQATIAARIRLGWPIEKAFSQKTRKRLVIN